MARRGRIVRGSQWVMSCVLISVGVLINAGTLSAEAGMVLELIINPTEAIRGEQVEFTLTIRNEGSTDLKVEKDYFSEIKLELVSASGRHFRTWIAPPRKGKRNPSYVIPTYTLSPGQFIVVVKRMPLWRWRGKVTLGSYFVSATYKRSQSNAVHVNILEPTAQPDKDVYDKVMTQDGLFDNLDKGREVLKSYPSSIYAKEAAFAIVDSNFYYAMRNQYFNKPVDKIRLLNEIIPELTQYRAEYTQSLFFAHITEMLSDSYFKTEQYEKCIETCRELIESYPDTHYAWTAMNRMAEAHIALGRFNEAQKWLHKTSTLNEIRSIEKSRELLATVPELYLRVATTDKNSTTKQPTFHPPEAQPAAVKPKEEHSLWPTWIGTIALCSAVAGAVIALRRRRTG